jgi:hypothetical protein
MGQAILPETILQSQAVDATQTCTWLRPVWLEWVYFLPDCTNRPS